MAGKFVHLHVHTEYSLLDGLSNISKLISHVKEKGMDTVAITDHGVMYGAIEFYKEAKKQDVKPIIGMEAYITNVELHKRPERGKFKNYHLLLLSKNQQGYKNLMKLTSIAHIDGYYYRPRIDKETLKKYSKGLICTSACPAGELATDILNDDFKQAKSTAEWHLDIFGDDYYLEIQNHRYEKYAKKTQDSEIKQELNKMAGVEKEIRNGVKKLSNQLGIPIIATNDSHYIDSHDAHAQDVLVCVATGRLVSEKNRIRFVDTPSFYVKSPSEMIELFPNFPEAIENTVKVAKKCNLEISLGKWFFPKFDLPKGTSDEKYLRDLAHRGLKKKIKKAGKKEKERLNYELDIICTKGYAPYFLIMMDLINWGNESGIVTNTRGSAAGSLVSYVLSITTINPLTYYLPFERFLNPFRPSPPDIDWDVPDNRREEIIGYMVDKYGKDKVAQICTFGRMLSRASVRDVARVLGYDYATGDKISKLIPPPKQGFPITIPKALEQVPQLKELYNTNADAKKILDLAQQVEGSARHISVHAAGVVISPTTLTDFTPIQKEPSGEKIITQYEMHASEDVGLLKIDVLGLKNLAILDSVISILQKSSGKRIDVWELPLDDKKTFEMLSKGSTMGVFQLSSSGMTKYIKELQPARIEDIMAMIALYRPGPIQVIPEYIARKRNPKLAKYLDPRMKKFLEATFGLIVYQDDLLFCAIELAGYTWKEADEFRKAVGKKIPKVMAAQKEKFIKGIVKNGQTKDFAENLWKLFEPFQAYGFNKAHAASYGMVSYQTAYMKANYPIEFMCALLTAESNDTDKISQAVTECRKMNIKVLAPDINDSNVDFTIVEDEESLEGKAIRFGLSAIKNVGEAAISSIVSTREETPFSSYADFLSRADSRKVNKKVVESLIKVGALSDFGSRAQLLSTLDEVRSKVSKPKTLKGQQGLFGAEEMTKGQEKMQAANISEFDEEELARYEKQLMGFSLSSKPISEAIGYLRFSASHKISDVHEQDPVEQLISVAGVVSEVRIVVTKKSGQEMAFVKVEDETGTIDLVVFPKMFQESREVWVEPKPLLVSGRVDFRDDSLSIVVEKFETKDSLKTQKNELMVRVPKSVNKEQMKKLKVVLLENPGNQSVVLMFSGTAKKLKLPYKVNWDETVARQIDLVFEES